MGLGNWLVNQERILGEILKIPCSEPSLLSCDRKLRQEPPFPGALISAGVKEGIWSQLALRLFLTRNYLFPGLWRKTGQPGSGSNCFRFDSSLSSLPLIFCS